MKFEIEINKRQMNILDNLDQAIDLDDYSISQAVLKGYLKAKNQIKPGDFVRWRTDSGINFGFAVFDFTGPQGMKATLEQRLFGIRKATPEEEKLIRPLLEKEND